MLGAQVPKGTLLRDATTVEPEDVPPAAAVDAGVDIAFELLVGSTS